jgi:DNA polymerase V
LVIVERSREAQHGDIVVASVNSAPMCKLHCKGRNIILQSESRLSGTVHFPRL